ncbi:hypothetical protein RND71_009839 [Anisodus tanguticus]|uniref:Secreted protein n=1 Tax=Anisodus tanguticus TaxID=243964 RepID=A0AAE1SGI6_9SOLA|nr:hypothetical protein RND71_009839 [Anisodus tanguticus]
MQVVQLVVLAGLVWNPPTSCAWAARVYVSSDEACLHGRKFFGLPSQVGRFSKKITALPWTPESKTSNFLSTIGLRASSSSYRNHMDVEVREIKNQTAMNICNINLNATVSQQDSKGWLGPFIKMSLPNISRRTKYNSNLLKYSCQIGCRPVHCHKSHLYMYILLIFHRSFGQVELKHFLFGH